MVNNHILSNVCMEKSWLVEPSNANRTIQSKNQATKYARLIYNSRRFIKSQRVDLENKCSGYHKDFAKIIYNGGVRPIRNYSNI